MNIQRTLVLSLVAVVGLLALPVSASAASTEVDGSSYYIVTHPDLRDCPYPTCGGYFVKAVNRASTLCADGQWRPECQAIELDTTSLNLTKEEKATFSKSYVQGLGLVRGTLSMVGWLPTLIAKEAWLGQALSEPGKDFYHVINSGIVCITFPCPSFLETRLNIIGISQMIAAVDLAASGASKEKVDAGYKALEKGILIAGDHEMVTGPAGALPKLVAREFYLPFLHNQGVPCGGNICGAGSYCCNASCGICAPIGQMCIQVQCN